MRPKILSDFEDGTVTEDGYAIGLSGDASYPGLWPQPSRADLCRACLRTEQQAKDGVASTHDFARVTEQCKWEPELKFKGGK